MGAGLAFVPLDTRPTRVARLSRLERQRPSCVSREVFECQLLMRHVPLYEKLHDPLLEFAISRGGAFVH